MKRRALDRWLNAHGCELDREGSRHSNRAADAFGMRANTVAEIRQRFVKEGLERPPERKHPASHRGGESLTALVRRG
jgi:1,2-phenylacetyl-CoA epoxidase catalytic subunit